MSGATERANGQASGPVLTSLFLFDPDHSAVVQNSQESGRKYWAIRPSIRLFARTAYSFAHTALLAWLARSAALIHSLARSLSQSQPRRK